MLVFFCFSVGVFVVCCRNVSCTAFLCLFFCVTVCLRCLCLRFLYFKIVGCEKVSGVRVSWWGAKNVWC